METEKGFRFSKACSPTSLLRHSQHTHVTKIPRRHGEEHVKMKRIHFEDGDTGLSNTVKGQRTASAVKWSELLATDPEVLVRFPALPDFLRISGSGTGFTQPREYN
jgi:hypothetical protein